jgi:nucleolar protein 58
MSLGLSHSLSRHKLKFSPDKVDTMIVQAIALLDDLDKELNTYAMRVKEWYGWHFPEMGRIVNDNLAYAKVILKMGMRTSATNSDLADILPEEIETAVKAAAEVSMGTEITSEDLDNIQALAEQVVGFTEYRSQLSSYLSARMAAIAPNLTALVGELVGARLIAHAGSLMNLAKSPASTIQILGAEKALFRALKTKHDTPKYGLIYHASLIGQATGRNKGKIARVLAAKAAIGIRVDALADWSAEGEGKGDMITEEEKSALGVESRLRIERRLASLEGRPLRSRGVQIAPNEISSQPGKWEVKEARKYNPDADGLTGDEPAAATPAPKTPKTPKSKKEDVKMIEEIEDESMEDAEESEDEASEDVAAQAEGDGEEDESEDEDEDEEMADEPEKPLASPPKLTVATLAANGTLAKGKAKAEDEGSVTISTVSADTPNSPDSPTQQETNWQSSILGNTKDAKKARKKERHQRKLALSEERSKKKALKNAKLARRLDRKERRLKRAEQIARREEKEYQELKPMAEKAGLTTSRYKRKLERGEIKFEADGTPVSISKKEIKKARKEAEKTARGVTNGDEDVTAGSKRKRVEEGGEKEKKKKKKSKAE